MTGERVSGSSGEIRRLQAIQSTGSGEEGDPDPALAFFDSIPNLPGGNWGPPLDDHVPKTKQVVVASTST